MSRLDNTIRFAIAAAIFAGAALPMSAQAQGKGKGKSEEKRAETAKGPEKVEAKRVDKGDLKRANKDGRVVTTSNGTVILPETPRAKRIPPGQAKKHVSTTQAVVVTRQVLLSNGYQIVNVIPSGTSQVIYYRRGNMGNGRGLGPVEKIVVVPSGQVVQFQSVPQSLLATILSRLGM